MALDRVAFSFEAEQCLDDLLRDGLQLPAALTQFFRGRRTKKKVEKAYDGLTALGFSTELIEAALTHAHDLTGALQYLCLYYPSESLPSFFRAYVNKPSTRRTTEGDPPVQLTLIPAAPSSLDDAPVRERVAPPPAPSAEPQKPSTEETDNAKAWTLQYLNSLDEDAQSPEATRRQLELDLAQATAALKGLKKSRKHEAGHWNAEIARLNAELAALAVPAIPVDAPSARSSREVMDAPSEPLETNAMDDDEDGGMDMFSMLEAAAPPPPPPAPVAAPSFPPPTHVEMASKWTGKTPRVQLHEYCQKQKWPAPHYTKTTQSSASRHRFDVLIKRRGTLPSLTVHLEHDGEAYTSADAAKDAVATRALYQLLPHLPLYRGLPPHFREMWLEWVRRVDAAKEITKSSASRSKAAIIDGLFHLAADTLCDDGAEGTSPTMGSAPDESVASTGTQAEAAAVVVESWDSDDDGGDAEDRTAVDDAIKSHDTNEQVDMPSDAAGARRVDLFDTVRNTRKYQAMAAGRQALPIAPFKREIVDQSRQSRVVLISGETGSGKSTQVPHFLLEAMLSSTSSDDQDIIVCTQPRRLAAIGVAERVAEEMDQEVGKGLVGYHIRLDAKKGRDCRLVFCTTGILLRMMQTNPTLAGVRHVVVDEIHERDVQSDILLGLLRRVLRTNSHLGVVLMSATLHAAQFQSYFAHSRLVAVPGRLFPVDTLYLEDAIERTRHVVFDGSRCCKRNDDAEDRYTLHSSGRDGRVSTQVLSWSSADVRRRRPTDGSAEDDGPYSAHTRAMMAKVDPSVINFDLIEELVEHLVLGGTSTDRRGAILIFLSGRGEIRTLIDQLAANRRLASTCVFLPLHAALSTSDQHRVFQRPPPSMTKVIVSTNIAETSLTIDDVTVVIDAGRVKQMRHDTKTQTSYLTEVWIAQANANQRAGRAGRVQAGTCFRLYPRDLFDHDMLPQPVAEIHRAPLTGLTLQLHELLRDESVDAFWTELLEPPAEQAVADATAELVQLGALDFAVDGAADNEDEAAVVSGRLQLTALGHHLAKLPLDARVGKMLLYASIFQVSRPAAIVAAILESKSPFVASHGDEKAMDAARRQFATLNSDVLTDLSAFLAWETSHDTAFCKKNSLNRVALVEIQQLAASFERLLVDLGFVRSSRASRAPVDMVVVAAVVAAGLYPNVVFIDSSGPTRTFWDRRKQVHTHPSSINHGATFATTYLGYYVKLVTTSKVYLPVSSGVTPLALALFGGRFDFAWPTASDAKTSHATIDKWIDLPCAGRSAMLVMELRRRLGDLLQRKLGTPSAMEPQDKALVDVVCTLWRQERGKDAAQATK